VCVAGAIQFELSDTAELMRIFTLHISARKCVSIADSADLIPQKICSQISRSILEITCESYVAQVVYYVCFPIKLISERISPLACAFNPQR